MWQYSASSLRRSQRNTDTSHVIRTAQHTTLQLWMIDCGKLVKRTVLPRVAETATLTPLPRNYDLNTKHSVQRVILAYVFFQKHLPAKLISFLTSMSKYVVHSISTWYTCHTDNSLIQNGQEMEHERVDIKQMNLAENWKKDTDWLVTSSGNPN